MRGYALSGASLPKLEQLTSIDQVITLTTITIATLGVGSGAVYMKHKEACPPGKL
jgi:hypothetical protein